MAKTDMLFYTVALVVALSTAFLGYHRFGLTGAVVGLIGGLIFCYVAVAIIAFTGHAIRMRQKSVSPDSAKGETRPGHR